MKRIVIYKMILYGIAMLGTDLVAFAAQRTEPSSRNEPQKPTDEKVEITKSLLNAEMSKPALQQRNPRYKLRYGDTFELKFPLTPEFDQPKVTVHPDGYVTLSGVSDVHVEGKTEEELNLAIRSAYKKILKDPIVSINLVDFEKPYFIVGGQVQRPGKFDMRGDTTLEEAVQMAGGFTKQAKHSQVMLIRRVSDQWAKVDILDVKKMENTADFGEDPHLNPGDMVIVPKSLIGKMSEYIRFEYLLWKIPF